MRSGIEHQIHISTLKDAAKGSFAQEVNPNSVFIMGSHFCRLPVRDDAQLAFGRHGIAAK
ncbi:MAG: hypothetical protein ACREFD_15815 [Stellaceae bacterium]